MTTTMPSSSAPEPSIADLDGPACDPFADTFRSLLAARAVISATSVGLFDAIAAGADSPLAIASMLDLDPLGVDVLVLALRSLGYVEVDPDGRLSLRPDVTARLTRGSVTSIATFIGPLNQLHWELLADFDRALTKEAAPSWHDRPDDDPTWATYVWGLYELSRGEHARNAALVPHERPGLLLDIGGAHGGFAMAMCRRHPALRATILDLPASARLGRAIVAVEGLAPRIDVQDGDALVDDLGSGVDVVSAFNLVQHLSPDDARRLLARMAAALAPGGVVVIGETLRPEPSRTPAAQGALTSLLFYAMTRTRTYALDELTGWMTEAGLTVAVHPNPVSPWRVVLIGTRQ